MGMGTITEIHIIQLLKRDKWKLEQLHQAFELLVFVGAFFVLPIFFLIL